MSAQEEGERDDTSQHTNERTESNREIREKRTTYFSTLFFVKVHMVSPVFYSPPMTPTMTQRGDDWGG